MSDKDALDGDRRKILEPATCCMGAVGEAAAAWPFIISMNPTAAVRAEADTSVELAGIGAGEVHTVAWRGKPVFVFHRTPEQVTAKTHSSGGKDPQPDSARVKQPEWLKKENNSTQQKNVPNKSEEGWLCP